MNRRQIANRNTIINRRYETKYINPVLASLNNVRDELINLVRNYGAMEAMSHFNNKLIINGITPIIKQLYTEVGVRYAKMYYSEMAKEPQQKSLQVKKEQPGLGFSQTWTNNIQAILQQFLTDKILFRTSETTKNLLLSVISQGIEAGWGIDRIVQDLTEFQGLKYQAERIVRTEVGRAANIGIIESGKSFKFEQMKEWISVRDTRTRGFNPKDHANHLSMNGQRVDFEQPFIDPRNLDLLMQPGDPSAKVESTINCRCTMGLIAKRDENGRLIPKRRANISVIMPGQISPFTQTITI